MSVVVDGPHAAAWQRRVIDEVAAAADLELAEILHRSAAPERWHRVWAAHRRAERRIFGGPPDPATPVPAPEPEGSGASRQLVLWLCEEPPVPADVTALGTDVLWLRHGDGARRSVVVRRAVHASEPCVATEVRRSRPGVEHSEIVARSAGGVRPYSLWRTEAMLLWRCARLIVGVARGAGPATGEPVAGPAAGGAPALPVFLARSAARWAGTVVRRLLFRRPWRVHVRRRAAGVEPTDGWTADRGPVAWRAGHVYADPMLFERDGRHHLFCEDVPPGSGRGVISHVELAAGGATSPPTPVLERDHHLSYPFVFAHDGDVLMIPESAAARRVELLRAVDFPRAWTLEAVLLEDVEAADATVAEHAGLLWMFVAIAAPGASLLEELHVFWAERPAGPWTAHERNPVVCDVRHARPAGPLFREGGRLIRPAQDGSRRYGWAVSLREVTRLTPGEYAEHEVGRLDPAIVRGARALHAYARDGAYEAIDVRVRVPRWWPGSLRRRWRPARRDR